MESRKTPCLHSLPVMLLAVMAMPGCRMEKPAVTAPQTSVGGDCPPCPVCPAAATRDGVKAPDGTGGIRRGDGTAAPKGRHDPSAGIGPETSILYHLTDLYTPVNFSHKSHTGYAGNCTVCHHHQSEVERTPPCRECHGLPFRNLSKPGLKGAYHRQCMNCHREMERGPLECDACHTRRTPVAKDEAAARESMLQGVSETITLGHLSKEYGPVSFHHKIHIDMADMCRECHHHQGEVEKTPPCRECHNMLSTPAGEKKPGLKDAYHKQCLGCHKGKGGPQKCAECHAAADKDAK